jgi:hypothetical protein
VTAKKSKSKVTQAFVDEIIDDVARLVVGERTMDIPVILLPKAIGEGAWIDLTVTAIAAPNSQSSAERQRHGLVQEDDGSDIKL